MVRVPVVVVLAASLASCVPSPQALRAPVDQLIGERIGIRLGAALDDQTAARIDAQIDALLAQPLDAATAIRIALARSPRVRAAFDELDVAAGDVAAALGLGPVTIDAKLRYGRERDEYELDAIQGLLGLVTAPGRRAAAHAELAAARATAAATALRLAVRVEIAFEDQGPHGTIEWAVCSHSSRSAIGSPATAIPDGTSRPPRTSPARRPPASSRATASRPDRAIVRRLPSQGSRRWRRTSRRVSVAP